MDGQEREFAIDFSSTPRRLMLSRNLAGNIQHIFLNTELGLKIKSLDSYNWLIPDMRTGLGNFHPDAWKMGQPENAKQ